MNLTAVSLFAGVGGFDLALQRAGVKVAAAVEIDSNARGVLRHRFPETQLFNDVREVTANDLSAAGFVGNRGVIVGGFPCQDLSVAGKRAGLAGERSGLFWQIMRLAKDTKAKWLILENVPGLLSSNGGRDMGTVIGAMAKCGYGVSWRVLDAQYFGVPQRRRRVFIVGCLGNDGAAPAEILALAEGRARYLASGRAKGQKPTQSTTTGSRTHNPAVGNFELWDFPTGDVSPTLNAQRARDAITWWDGGQIAQTLDAVLAKGQTMPDKNRFPAVLVPAVGVRGEQSHALTSEGHDASEDGTGRGTPIIAFSHNQGLDPQPSTSVTPTLRTGGDGAAVLMPNREGKDGGGKGPLLSDDKSLTLATNNDQTLFQPVAFDEYNGTASDTHHTLRAGTKQSTGVLVVSVVRRLTPVECERLQGFPDGWTEQRWDEKKGQIVPQADSARYKQMGNAVAVPVVQWIINRLVAVA